MVWNWDEIGVSWCQVGVDWCHLVSIGILERTKEATNEAGAKNKYGTMLRRFRLCVNRPKRVLVESNGSLLGCLSTCQLPNQAAGLSQFGLRIFWEWFPPR